MPHPGGTGSPRKKGLLLPLIGVLLPALLLGGVLGGVTGLVTTEVPGSTTPPAFAADFPGGDQQYLPSVTLSMIVDDWMKKANSWKCTQEAGDPDAWSRAKRRTTCEPPDGRGDMYVDIEYDSPDKVKVVEATCRLGNYTRACTTLFSTMADAVFIGRPKLRKSVAAWAKKNADSERHTIIGGVRLQANLEPHGLRITPEV